MSFKVLIFLFFIPLSSQGIVPLVSNQFELTPELMDKYTPNKAEWIEYLMQYKCKHDDVRRSYLSVFNASIISNKLYVQIIYFGDKFTSEDKLDFENAIKQCFENYKKQLKLKELTLKVEIKKV